MPEKSCEKDVSVPSNKHITTTVGVEVCYFGAKLRFFMQHEVERQEDNKRKIEMVNLAKCPLIKSLFPLIRLNLS